METKNEDANNVSMSNGSRKINNVKETKIEKLVREAKLRQEEVSKMDLKTFFLYNSDMGGYYETMVDDSPYFINELKFQYLDNTLDQINQLFDYVEKERNTIKEYNEVFEMRMDLKRKLYDLYVRVDKMRFY